MQISVSDSQLQAAMDAKRKPSFDVLARAAGAVEAVYEGQVPHEHLQKLVRACELDPELGLRVVVGDRWVVVGGLVHDEDCDDPLESAGMGRILVPSFARELYEFREALGLDEDGNRDISAEPVQAILLESVRKRIAADRNLKGRLMRAMVRHGRTVELFDAALAKACMDGGRAVDFTVEFAGQHPHTLADSSRKADHRLVADCQALSEGFDQLAAEAWKQARREGKVGEPLAVMLDVYEHGSRHYSLAGTGPQCPWDTSSRGALWVPDAWARDAIAMQVKASGVEPIEAARRSAAVAASEYTKWVNGEVFGAVVYSFNRATGERLTNECAYWNLIGSDYATDELEACVLGTIPELDKAHAAH